MNSDIKQTVLVYRGVAYTKDGQNKPSLFHRKLEKIYRGAKYLKIPSLKHKVCDHIYRGAHYMA